MENYKLNFAKMNGLLPIVIQDYQNQEVLMVGFMNEEAWALTKKTGKVHYWSRKKKRIWMKGEESGHYQYVKAIYLDNDNDSLLIKVDQLGGAVEDGYRSCFYRIKKGRRFVVVGEKVFDPKKVYKNYSEVIRFAIPSGSVYAMTITLLGLAGYQLELRGRRSFHPQMRSNKNIQLVVARAQEIPKLVETGRVDIGLTGMDLVEESGVSVTDLLDAGYNEHGKGFVYWVLAIPIGKKREYQSLKDFRNKRVVTELINTTQKFFSSYNIPVHIEPSVGATEGKVPQFADAVIDLAETGQSLKDNGLIPLYKIRSSTIHLVAYNHSMAYGWKRRSIEDIVEKLKKATRKLPRNQKRLIRLPSL